MQPVGTLATLQVGGQTLIQCTESVHCQVTRLILAHKERDERDLRAGAWICMRENKGRIVPPLGHSNEYCTGLAEG